MLRFLRDILNLHFPLNTLTSADCSTYTPRILCFLRDILNLLFPLNTLINSDCSTYTPQILRFLRDTLNLPFPAEYADHRKLFNLHSANFVFSAGHLKPFISH